LGDVALGDPHRVALLNMMIWDMRSGRLALSLMLQSLRGFLNCPRIIGTHGLTGFVKRLSGAVSRRLYPW